MNKEIDAVEFWAKRIRTALREHFSVYVTTDQLWQRIGEIHQKIIQDNCGGRILDAGCGYGRVSEWVKDYTGLDFSPAFLEKAKEKYPERNFVQGDLRKMPFEDKSFDWAICISIRKMVIENLGQEEWKKMEAELRRVACKILILEYTEPKRFWIL